MPWRFNPFTGNLDETDIPAFNGEVTLGSAASPSIFFSGDPNTGIYSPGADQVAISTNGTGRLFVDSSGNVGVGTTSPGVALHVDGDIRADGIYGETDTNTSIQFPGSDVITFNEGGSEAARIDSSGRLLVGTSSARSIFDLGTSTLVTPQIQIEGSTVDASSLSIKRNDNNAGSSRIFLAKTRGGVATIVNDDDGVGQIVFNGADGTNLVEAASISAEIDGTPGANDMPGRLVVSTTADGASSPTERLRITSAGVLQVADAGNIAVGTTTGTKIGTANTQKLGFWNATPVVQPAAVADATDAATVITQLNDLLAKLRTLGIIAT